jgi:putative ABC transport system substrate-binding protein
VAKVGLIRPIGLRTGKPSCPFVALSCRHDRQLSRQLSGKSALDVTAIRVHSDAEVDAAIAQLATMPHSALMAPPSAFNAVHRHEIVTQALAHRPPAVVHFREAVADGGLMCYGPDETDIFRRAVPYVDRILKGAKPGDLPVQAPTKFDFVINLKTAKLLGLNVPTNLLAIADEVIE